MGANKTGLNDQTPVAGTDARAVDTFTPATGSNGTWVAANPSSTKTITHTTEAGNASTLAGLKGLINESGDFMEGVTLNASGVLSAGTATVTVAAAALPT
jgi:hypothetical protein